MKSQTVRLIDVFAIGPLMIYAGLKKGTLPPGARLALALTGIATIAYNANNYLLLDSIEQAIEDDADVWLDNVTD